MRKHGNIYLIISRKLLANANKAIKYDVAVPGTLIYFGPAQPRDFGPQTKAMNS